MSPQQNFKFSRQIDPVSEPCYITTLPQPNTGVTRPVTNAPSPAAPRIETPKLPPRNTAKVTQKVPPRYQPTFVPEVPLKLSNKGEPKSQRTTSEFFLPESPRRNSVHFHPDIVSPSSPLKGILKNIGNSSFDDTDHLYEECKVIKTKVKPEETRHNSHSNVRHFNLNVHESGSVATKDSNDVISSTDERTNSKRKKKDKEKKAALDKTESPLLGKSKFGKASQDKKTTTASIKYQYNSYEKATKAAKMESISGVIHLLVIILCIVIIVLMTKVNHDWQLLRRRCPLYVKGVASINVYWGNEKNAACNYGAFMPVLILIMSLTLILFHGGVLCSWRHGGDTSKILLSRTYPKIMFFIELFELALLISVASVLTDGFRQTCVGFQMNPWPEYRPMQCKEGFKNRDEAYGISHTYSRIFGSIIVAWIAVMFLLASVVCFLTRSKFGKKK